MLTPEEIKQKFESIRFPHDANAEPVAILYGLDQDTGEIVPIKLKKNADETYSLDIQASIAATDIQIGAVEIKDHDSDKRADIVGDGEALPATKNGIFIFGTDGANSKLFNLESINSKDILLVGSYLKDSLGNLINPAREDGNLLELKNKDFATETTLKKIEKKNVLKRTGSHDLSLPPADYISPYSLDYTSDFGLLNKAIDVIMLHFSTAIARNVYVGIKDTNSGIIYNIQKLENWSGQDLVITDLNLATEDEIKIDINQTSGIVNYRIIATER